MSDLPEVIRLDLTRDEFEVLRNMVAFAGLATFGYYMPDWNESIRDMKKPLELLMDSIEDRNGMRTHLTLLKKMGHVVNFSSEDRASAFWANVEKVAEKLDDLA